MCLNLLKGITVSIRLPSSARTSTAAKTLVYDPAADKLGSSSLGAFALTF